MEKECLLTTYVAGKRYQAFIPLLVYSCKKAYPEYDIILFLHETLEVEIKLLLEKSGLIDKVIIRENVYAEDTKMNALKAASYRWVLWDDIFLTYKYLYIVDIDMFYIREPKPLHLQHVERMQVSGLPFDNLVRKFRWKRTFRALMRRIKYAHFHKLPQFISHKVIADNGLSGLHFIDIHSFYTSSNREYLDTIRARIKLPYYFPEIMVANNEVLLYRIVTDLGYDCSWLGFQSSPTIMLSFADNMRKEFRPHHGIHLGIFKSQSYSEWSENTRKSVEPILNSEAYSYYVQKYIEIFRTDEFQKFL